MFSVILAYGSNSEFSGYESYRADIFTIYKMLGLQYSATAFYQVGISSITSCRSRVGHSFAPNDQQR